jgi:hypothetical protein
MFTGLSLDQAPPFEAPLKFFLSAPIFAIIFGIVVLFSSGFYLHDPKLIATIHILTLGFMVMIIFGALQQMLPVVAGAVIPKAKLVANITYTLLLGGIVTFFLAFFTYKKVLFFISATLLLGGLLFFTLIALWQLIKVKPKTYIVKGMIFSLIFFLFAFLLGIHLFIAQGTLNIGVMHYDFAALHYNYIFFGFMFLLIVSITIQVVPMFWVTDAYKKTDQAIFIYSTIFLIILFTITMFMKIDFNLLYKSALSLVVLYFAYTTVQKLGSRKRKLKDITVYFYLTSMIFLSLGIVYWFISDIFGLGLKPLGVLFGLGFIVSLINGMLYKIVPFLTWFHLSSKGLFDIPTMRDMIPIKKVELQFYFHITATLLFLISFIISSDIILKLGALVFIISNILFFINIFKASRVYFKHS